MKIEVLYPEICNLYGDLANIRYLKESIPDATIIETSLKSVPEFVSSKVDLIYMGTTTEDGIRLVVNALSPYKEKLKELTANGQLILLTGNAQDIFCIDIDSDRDCFMYKTDSTSDGQSSNSSARHIDGLGIINAHVKYQMMNRHNSFFTGTFKEASESIDIVGFKSIFGFAYDEPSNDQKELFSKVRGNGRNPETELEGYRINNLMATHLTGPLLVLNPLFTKYLMKKLGFSGEPAHFESAMAAFNQRFKEFGNEHFDPNY